jgi:hypothetical protein
LLFLIHQFDQFIMSDEFRKNNNNNGREREEATKDSDDEPPRKKRFKRTFDDCIQLLFAYKQKHGQYNIISSNDESLYRWVLKVRKGEIDLTYNQLDTFRGVDLGLGGTTWKLRRSSKIPS